MHRSPSRLARLLLAMALLAALLAAPHHATPALAAGSTNTFFVLTADNRIAALTEALPDQPTTPLTILGLAAGETLVGIDVRPQNGLLYGLGVDATANTGTLYLVNPQNGTATAIGAPGQVAFTTDGVTVVDLPDPATVGYGFDFNPTVDRARVVAGSLNFRVHPNTGAPLDSDGSPANGTNPDFPINGGATTVDGAAYTNNTPNATVTTLYTLDAASNSLFIQNPANNGTQTNPQMVTLNGNPLDFTSNSGFDIPPGVDALSSDAPASGASFAMLIVGGQARLYRIELSNGVATLLGTVGNITLRGLAVWLPLPIGNALSANGSNLVRFRMDTLGTSTSVAISGVAAGETLVGIDGRPATGQLYGLGIDATANTGSLYLLDPHTGAATTIGTPGQITFTTDGTTVVDLPDPAAVGYGLDFDPTTDRARVTTGSGLNFRVNPNTGAPADGNLGGASGSVTGINPDGAFDGLPGGSTGVAAAAYTNNYAGATASTLYTIDPTSDRLFIQNPANAGTQTNGSPLTVAGSPLDATALNGFDIPPGASAATSGAPAGGNAYAILTVGGVPGLYRIDLATGAATSLGTAPASGIVGFVAWSETPSAQLTGATTVNEHAGAFELTIKATGGAPTIVAYSVVSDFATAGDDFTPISGTLLLGGSQITQTLSIPIVDDDETEFDETFEIQLLGADGVEQTQTLTIVDNDPMVEFTSADYDGSEVGGTAHLTVILEQTSPTTATVNYATVADTATPGSDYTPISGTLTFAPGQTSKELVVPILGDLEIDAGETFTVTLRDPVGAVLCAVIDARITIADDKPFSTAQFGAATYTGSEVSGTALVTVTLDQPAATITSVHYATAGGTATAGSDYTPISGILAFALGQTSKTLVIPVLADSSNDAGETFNMTLSAPVGVALGTPTSTQVTIADDQPKYTLFLPIIRR